ncbi:Ankyrin repeat-containing domain [Balamuthia mandrillaris]
MQNKRKHKKDKDGAQKSRLPPSPHKKRRRETKRRSRSSSSGAPREASALGEEQPVTFAQKRCWIEELLPEELLCHIFNFLPEDGAAVAARTCHRWFRCCPEALRHVVPHHTLFRHLPLLKWAVGSDGYTLLKDYPLAYTIHAAAAEGSIEVVEWLVLKKSVRRDNGQWEWVAAAASAGRLDVLRWLHGQGFALSDETACVSAAKQGHLDALKWLHVHGCPWGTDTCEAAAFGGRLDVLDWLLATKPGAWRNVAISELVMGQANAEALQWLCDKGLLTLERLQHLGSAAARVGNLEALKWGTMHGCLKQSSATWWAATRGDVEMLQWTHANGYPWDANTCSCAAMAGHLEVLKWLRENGCPWDATTPASAALSGHLEVLKWLRANGCPWDEISCTNAAAAGKLEAVMWLHEQGCPWGNTTCFAAALGQRWEVVTWIIKHGCPLLQEQQTRMLSNPAKQQYQALLGEHGLVYL